MKISSGAVVSIHYTLTDDQGQVIDSSQGQDPLQYEHGSGNIIPGLEKALDGRASGDSVQVTVEPEEAYGQRNDEMDCIQRNLRQRGESGTGHAVSR